MGVYPLPIAVTMGDPAGIGPEICLKACASDRIVSQCVPILVGDAEVFTQVAHRLGLAIPDRVVDREEDLDLASWQPSILNIPAGLAPATPSVATPEGGRASHAFVARSVAMALRGLVAAVATAPITKLSFKMAGIDLPGHTEMLALLTQSPSVTMMLYSDRIAVSFATCHQALSSVPSALSAERIIEVSEHTGRALERIRGKRPKLALLALNPHASESGMFGDEEERILAPAAEAVRRLGWDMEGPLPADSAFTRDRLARYDGYVTLYHDQGGIPFKLLSFDEGVNVTLGLPIVRTSVDHGSAYDIAWRGIASPHSMEKAIELAVKLAEPSGRSDR
jgi:4-hydroxythreonine-4-phosphate dehydrogenase